MKLLLNKMETVDTDILIALEAERRWNTKFALEARDAFDESECSYWAFFLNRYIYQRYLIMMRDN